MNDMRFADPRDEDLAMDKIISFEEFYDPIEYADGDEWEDILRQRRRAARCARLQKPARRLCVGFALTACATLALYAMTAPRRSAP